MPTYDYRCNACGHTFEEFQMMSDPVLRKCPACGQLKLERLIGTGAGFVFKGSGYYVTDYRSKGYDDAKKADAPSKDSASGDGGGSSSGSSSGDSASKPKSTDD
ncbi:MAG: zinc ribbon domain-containing protein [Planctomycetota bacterium]